MEDLAIFVADKSFGAVKSGLSGIDFEYTVKGVRFLVSVKSGLNWGNSSQWKSLEADFKSAIRTLKQSGHVKHVDCFLGVAYGKTKTTVKRGLITQICGQNFWYMISGKENFYIDIIEPLGYKAKKLNEEFNIKKSEIINKFTKEFIEEYCNTEGKILWKKLVEYNSKNITDRDRSELLM